MVGEDKEPELVSGANVEDAFEWNSPPFEVSADYEHDTVTRHFKSLEEYNHATRQEQHSILIDFDIFVKVGIPDKSDPQHLYKPEDFDFRLKPGSRAVDAGAVLPSITDDFTGRAPDLGAYELDRRLELGDDGTSSFGFHVN